ncbi:MAG: NAD(P)-dependent alcohol dehydrogenase [Gammaproteobacteria bacterium]|nr:NAD(P)-dependent alcohol dehydrogenase [Gammaproteobacteria bacterium]
MANQRSALPRNSAPLGIVFLVVLAFSGVSACAQDADTFRQYQFEPSPNGYRLVMKELPRPAVGADEVLVRVRATSLNRRDVNMLRNDYGDDPDYAGGIPLSDGAGEVIAVGEDVTRFAVGDRVAGIFFEQWIDGAPSEQALLSDRGGNVGGMLSEIIVTHEDGLVSIPEHLSYEEAATLPCAAVTAWVGLFKRGRIEPGQYVLLEGTGGVSVFGLIFSDALGAKPIMTSSRDEKLERAVQMGAIGTANYRSNPDWQLEVKEVSGGHGVDQVLDVGGRDTLSKALEILAYGGHIALIGGLSGYGSDVPTDSIMWINATVSGIYVGSREDFDAMNAFISEHEIRPLIDRVFEFEEARAAFELMESGDFMGKIVIRH